jgi:hypothetical protein
MPNRGSQTTTLNITGASKPTKSISAGYISASTITAQVDSSKANIIKKGETLGGCEGTYDAHQIYTYTPADPVELGYWRSSDGTGIKSFSWNIPNVPFVVNKILIELYIVREYNAEEDRHRMRAIVSKNFDFGQPYSYDNGSYSGIPMTVYIDSFSQNGTDLLVNMSIDRIGTNHKSGYASVTAYKAVLLS